MIKSWIAGKRSKTKGDVKVGKKLIEMINLITYVWKDLLVWDCPPNEQAW